MYFKFLLFVFLLKINLINSYDCNQVKLQRNPKINITEYIRKTWYIQTQQINGYQPLDSLNCVLATYNIDNNSHVPFFKGKVISVYNYANIKKVNRLIENNSSVLCARQKNETEPEKLLVAPCFLPNIFGGPYWILYAGPYSYNYEWAIVIGGQPTIKYNNTCTTKEYGINNSGLWLFSRDRILEKSRIDFLINILKKNNITTDRLIDVNQTGCNYQGAFIK